MTVPRPQLTYDIWRAVVEELDFELAKTLRCVSRTLATIVKDSPVFCRYITQRCSLELLHQRLERAAEFQGPLARVCVWPSNQPAFPPHYPELQVVGDYLHAIKSLDLSRHVGTALYALLSDTTSALQTLRLPTLLAHVDLAVFAPNLTELELSCELRGPLNFTLPSVTRLRLNSPTLPLLSNHRRLCPGLQELEVAGLTTTAYPQETLLYWLHAGNGGNGAVALGDLLDIAPTSMTPLRMLSLDMAYFWEGLGDATLVLDQCLAVRTHLHIEEIIDDDHGDLIDWMEHVVGPDAKVSVSEGLVGITGTRHLTVHGQHELFVGALYAHPAFSASVVKRD